MMVVQNLFKMVDPICTILEMLFESMLMTKMNFQSLTISSIRKNIICLNLLPAILLLPYSSLTAPMERNTNIKSQYLETLELMDLERLTFSKEILQKETVQLIMTYLN